MSRDCPSRASSAGRSEQYQIPAPCHRAPAHPDPLAGVVTSARRRMGRPGRISTGPIARRNLIRAATRCSPVGARTDSIPRGYDARVLRASRRLDHRCMRGRREDVSAPGRPMPAEWSGLPGPRSTYRGRHFSCSARDQIRAFTAWPGYTSGDVAEFFDVVERAQLCDLFEELGPGAPTLLAPWTTRDLAGHLVLRERDYLAGPGVGPARRVGSAG